MKSMAIGLATLFLVSAVAVNVNGDHHEEGKKPKHTIKEVMVGAHKDVKLLQKVVAGEASPKEKLMLLDYYVSLGEAKPPQGDAKKWKAVTDAIVVATAQVVVGREGATDVLKKATNCMACHKEFKPPSN